MEKRALLKEIHETVRILEESQGENAEKEKELKQQLAVHRKLERDHWEEMEQLGDDMLNSLTTIQQAKFLIFRETFHNELRETVRRVREQQMAPPQREGRY